MWTCGAKKKQEEKAEEKCITKGFANFTVTSYNQGNTTKLFELKSRFSTY